MTSSFFQQIPAPAKKKILHPKSLYRPSFCEDVQSPYRCVSGQEGSYEQGWIIQIFLLVDETDGVIADGCYQAFGPPWLIAIIETLIELALRKNYVQASRLNEEMIDRQLRERIDKVALVETSRSLAQAVLQAFFQALKLCSDIPIHQEVTPVEQVDDQSAEYLHFLQLQEEEKYRIVEEVIARDIRPYVQLDEGNVIIKNIAGYQIKIAYQGSCTSCFSATGSTLHAIEQVLRKKINPHLNVVPDLSSLMAHHPSNVTG